MLHADRVFSVTAVSSPEALEEAMMRCDTWTCCTGWQLATSERTVFLFNDSTSPDQVQEYAVYCDGVQVESLTVSWMQPQSLAARLRSLLKAPLADLSGNRESMPTWEPWYQHQPCPHCR